eukprot:Skav200451  [mRNA]  locus=scaffold1922:176249:177079:- [translate_table: standard]
MSCPNCKTYHGVPVCSCCQTHFRIGNLLQSGRLSVYQEGAVLSALRNCAGALADLCEGEAAGGPFGPKKLDSTGQEIPETGKWPESRGKEPVEKEGTEGAKSSASKRKKREGKGVKEKRRPKKVEKPSKKRSPSPDRTTKRKKKSEESGSKSEEEEESPEERRRSKATSIGEREPLPRLQERVDRHVESHPKEYGLRGISVRGSVARHLSETHSRGHEAPPEPEGPPPNKEREEFEEYLRRKREKERDRSPGKPKKEKGFKHWQRGRHNWRSKNRG